MSPKSLSQDVESTYSAPEVIAQLKLILSHELFNNSAVLSNFLKYIVEETLAGNLKSLKEYTIGVNGLGKKVDFNPQIDAIVRIHAGRLRRLLTEYYNGPGAQDRILIEVVKGSYVPVFSQRVFTDDHTMMLSPSLSEIKHVDISKVTVAILPFRNLCPQNDHQFFADALGEEFTQVFSTSREFAVIGHQSTLKHAQLHTNLHTIGQKLNAQYVVTGTVMKSDDLLRINVALLETASSTHIWSKPYEYKIDVGFMPAQDQTIQHAYATLGGAFGVIVRHSTLTKKSSSEEDCVEFNPAIFNYQLHTDFSFFTYAKTRKVLEIVHQNDPYFSIAIAMLAELYLWGHILGYPTADDAVATSSRLAQKAKNVDPLSTHACFSTLWASLYTKGSAALQTAVDERLTRHPHTTLDAAALGTLLVWGGLYEQAEGLLETAVASNPNYSWSIDLALALVYFNSNRHAQALDMVERISATDIYLVDLLKIVLLTRLGLSHKAKPYLDSLEENYSFVALNLKTHLSKFVLDKSLINKIMNSVDEARVAIR